MMQTDKTVRFLIAKNRLKPILFAMILAIALIFSNVIPLQAQNKSSSSTSQNLTQKKKVTGTVKDETGQPLIGVTITVKGNSIGTISDINGEFSIVVPNNISILYFSYIGMEQKMVSIENTTKLKVTLVEEANKISEVVVVGYGTQKKATVTGAISSVASKELIQSSQANISNALVGRMSGLTAVQKSGEPGKDQATIRIRGIGTFADENLQNPLVMVDGVESETYNNIDPNEIDNVTILKDASATAVYGVRGANGVILITTKRGTTSKPQVSLSTNFATQNFTDLRKPMNAYDWASSINEAITYDGYITGNYTPKFSEEELIKFRDHTDPIFYPDTDWTKMIFKDRTSQSQHNLNISGGSEKVKYFVSLGYISQEGMYNNTDMVSGYDAQVNYDRYNFRTNFDFQITKDLSLSLNVSDQLENRKSPNFNSEYILSMAFDAPPTSGPGVYDGKIINNLPGRYNFNPNPIYGLNFSNGQLKTYGNQLNASTRVAYKLDALIKGLAVHSLISYQNYNTHTTRYVKQVATYNAVRTTDGSTVFIPVGSEGAFGINEMFGKNRKEYFEAGIDYSHKFGDHTFGGLLLYNQSKYYSPSLAYLIPNGYQGLVGRITYDYKNRYLAEVNAGYNGTENFAPNKRFGVFPAFSLGWVPSEEKFFSKNDIVSYIKLRGSLGVVGNDKIGGNRFLYRPTAYLYNVSSPDFYGDNVVYNFGVVGQNYTAYNTSSEGKMGNPDLTWERAVKMNVGVDLRIWKDKIKITADLFRESRSDILTDRATIPAIVAADMPAYNMGKMTNGGFDGEINFRDRVGKLNYWLKGIYTFARNKVIFRDEVNPTYPYMKRTGQRLNQFFGFIAEGFYNSWEEVNDPNRPVSSFQNNKIQPGDVKYKDVNGDGVINSFDMVPIGYSNFPEVSYGFSFGGEFIGFDLSVLFQGSSNVSSMASSKSMRGFQQEGGAIDYLKDYSWTPERYANADRILFPHISSTASQQNNYQSSTLWVRDASYLRIKNVEIGYTLPGNFLKKVGVSSLRIYVNANNLYTWDKLFPGEDPEIPSYGGGDYEPYPLLRTMNLGLNVKF